MYSFDIFFIFVSAYQKLEYSLVYLLKNEMKQFLLNFIVSAFNEILIFVDLYILANVYYK